MIEINHIHGRLDLAANTSISFEENSKGADANIFHFDFNTNITLPYSPDNVKAYNRYGWDKFKIQIKSDGAYIGEYYAQVIENKYNLNLYTGSLTLKIVSKYAHLNDELTKAKLKDNVGGGYTISYQDETTELRPGETKLHAWLRTYQANPNPAYPFRFPEYNLAKEYVKPTGTPFENMQDTMEEEFGNWVAVNHLNNQYLSNPIPPLPSAQTPIYEVRYNVLYDRKSYNVNDASDGHIFEPISTVQPTGIPPSVSVTHNYLNASQPRRIWGLACPCFSYIDILSRALNMAGYNVDYDWANADEQHFFENIYLLNNYNVFDLQITRTEGSTIYYAYNSSFGQYIDYSSREYWLGTNATTPNPAMPIQPATIVQPASLVIDPKNHVPDITVMELIEDFIAKSNMILNIEGTTIRFSRPKVKQSEVKHLINPNIQTTLHEYAQDKTLSYDYVNEDIYENIPDYKITNENKDGDMINSKIVPNYVHSDTISTHIARYAWLLGTPSIDQQRCWNKVNVQNYFVFDHVFASGFSQPVAGIIEERSSESDYEPVAVPLVCGVRMTKLQIAPLSVLVGMYYLWGLSLEETVLQVYVNNRSLRWEGSDGIYEKQYKDLYSLFKAKYIHKIKETVTMESFSKFDHYHYISLEGKKIFLLRRGYTLPLSRNTSIDYDGYEVD
jgi:hypothetical protein